jgi:protein-L-isoaspartate(D-aspartate) O-methyltransferase
MHADPYGQLRDQMVAEQLIARGVRDLRVVAAMRTVPRHAFIPEALHADAYLDKPVRIGSDQTISQPFMVGLMTQELCVEPHHRVLEIGTGSGYQTAVLSALCAEVFTIERVPVLAERAGRALAALGHSNVRTRVGDGTEGWPEAAPFDRILVTAAAPRVPAALEEQLREGGRLLVPVGPRDRQVLTAIDRTHDGWVRSESIGCVFVPLIGREGWAP